MISTRPKLSPDFEEFFFQIARFLGQVPIGSQE
jgi:hypothetical protein